MQTYKFFNDPLVHLRLLNGEVAVMPTDTIYGLVCSVAFPDSANRIHQLKQPSGKPGTIIAASIDQLRHLGLHPPTLQAVQALWPNPVSVVVDAGDELEYLHLGVGSLAVRVPAHDELRDLLELTGPLMTSSANMTGQPVVQTHQEAFATFGDDVDFYIELPESTGNTISSTVIKIDEEGRYITLRPGAVTISEKGEIL